MIINILGKYETPKAIELAKQVYDNTIRPYMQDASLAGFFDEYADGAQVLVENEELTIWGAYEKLAAPVVPGYGAPNGVPGYGAPNGVPGYGVPNGVPGYGAPADSQPHGGMTLVGMCAMNTQGHITMLYVLPHLWKRGIGTALVTEAREHAGSVLKLENVTANVIPTWNVPFFLKKGFVQIPNAVYDIKQYAPLWCQSIKTVKYQKRTLSEKQILITAFSFLGIIAVLVTLYFISMFH